MDVDKLRGKLADVPWDVDEGETAKQLRLREWVDAVKDGRVRLELRSRKDGPVAEEGYELWLVRQDGSEEHLDHFEAPWWPVLNAINRHWPEVMEWCLPESEMQLVLGLKQVGVYGKSVTAAAREALEELAQEGGGDGK